MTLVPTRKHLTAAVLAAAMALQPSGAIFAQEAPAQAAPSADERKKPDEIVIASWGGAYAQSQERAYFKPFRSHSGIAVRVVNHGGKAGSGIQDGGNAWDVVDLSAGAAEKACREGLLVKIDTSRLPAAKDGTMAAQDFLPGALGECAVGSVAWAAAIAYDKREYTRKQPARAADVFDIKAFPGKRALPKGPKYLFELALAAAGVPVDKIYETLATDAGLDKALAELDKIRMEIVWWERAAEPLKLLADGEVDMALAFNGRIFASVVGENQPFGLIWDGHVYDMDMWAIPRTSANTEAALDFIAFASRPERLAAQTRWFPYGPLRKSALAMVDKHAEIDVDMRSFVPTMPDHFRNAVAFDAGFWNEHEERIAKRLDEWRTAKAEQDAAKEKDGAEDE